MATAQSSPIPAPPLHPIELVPSDRSHRAVLQNLGQLYRYDLSEAYQHLPNADGTFNNRRLDRFLAGVDPDHRAWLVTVAGALGGFVMTAPIDEGHLSVSDFFIVRALRRHGVGRVVAARVLTTFLGRWSVGFQSYNPGVERFWTQVATDAVGDQWTKHDDPAAEGRPPDSWITFTTHHREFPYQ